MCDNGAAKGIYSIYWPRGGRDVICYALGTEAEAERCRELLAQLRGLVGDDGFTDSVRALSDEQYAEEIIDLADWEADLEELGNLFELLLIDIIEAGEEAKRAQADQIVDLESDIAELRCSIAAREAAIVAIEATVSAVIAAES